MGWADVAKAFLDLIKNPSVATFILILAILAYVLPMGVVTFNSWDNTNRLETAILRLGNCLDTHKLARRPQ